MTDTSDAMKRIALPCPIVRGEMEITELGLRKPKAGELRGLSIGKIMDADIATMITLLTRISAPPLTEHEASALEPENLVELSGEIIGFFLTPAQRAMLETESTG